MIKDKNIDLCCVTETWLTINDKAKFAEIHDHGFDIFSAPRKGRGGGVAFVFDPDRVKPIRNKVKHFSSFEVLECVVKTSSHTLRLIVVYRTTQTKTKQKYDDTKVSKFLKDFKDYLDTLKTKCGIPIVMGDFNFHLDDPNDSTSKKFSDLYIEHGFVQHVDKPTHVAGHTLDLVLSPGNITDAIVIKNLVVEPDHGTASDHFLVHFDLPVTLGPKVTNASKPREFRKINEIDLEMFKFDLQASPISRLDYESLTLDNAIDIYHDVLETLLDKHAPLISKNCKLNKTPWWDETCSSARRERRKAERSFRKSRDVVTRTIYKEKCVDSDIIITNARNHYYDRQLSSVVGDSRATYKVINKLLDKQYGANVVPNGKDDKTVADNLKDFFVGKVDRIYKEISASQEICEEPTITKSDSTSSSPKPEFNKFSPISTTDLKEIIKELPNKSSALDAIPIFIFKHCEEELIGIVQFIVNQSLTTGKFPDRLKSAMIRPSLKKPGLDTDDLTNYRPISNLSYLSKLIEKIVNNQLTTYINENNLFADFQSSYRKFHSCETAVTRIHNDILMMVDQKRNVILLLLDLSAAFDTINHKLLLKKLTNLYGISGDTICWIKDYLNNRTFKVAVESAQSSVCNLTIGVPQGSILGPLLFILYTKDLQAIVSRHGMSVHLYADDTQIYFSFDVHSHNPDIEVIRECFSDIKSWMANNFLKMNAGKTVYMDIGVYESPFNNITLSDKITLEPELKAKNLGFVFDHQMNLDDEVTATIQVCNMNLRNLWKIGRHLSHELKVQLVHSSVLFFLDYCNSVYSSLTEANIRKLQKAQNDAARFVFGIYDYKAKRQPVSPLLKKLHFLPVRYRISYKIALLTFKCLNNLAPHYLTSLITVREPNRRASRLDDDFYVLSRPAKPNFRRTEGAFSHAAPRIWNNLPYELRCLTDINIFKNRLKTHFFDIAFDNYTDI